MKIVIIDDNAANAMLAETWVQQLEMLRLLHSTILRKVWPGVKPTNPI